MNRTKQLLLAAVACSALLGTSLSPALLAQDNYDQQQWWNPGDWFDDQQQYNLYSDPYWNDTYDGHYDTDDYGDYGRGDPTFDYDDSGYGEYDPGESGADYGFYDTWDYEASEWGYNDESWGDLWDDDETGLGTTGSYESGFGSDADE